MSIFKIKNNPNEITLNSKWISVTDFSCKDKIVDEKGQEIGADYQGRKYRIIEKREWTFSKCMRFRRGLLGVVVVICSFCLALFSKNVRDLFIQSKKTKYYAVPVKDDLPQPNSSLPGKINSPRTPKTHPSIPQRQANLSPRMMPDPAKERDVNNKLKQSKQPERNFPREVREDKKKDEDQKASINRSPKPRREENKSQTPPPSSTPVSNPLESVKNTPEHENTYAFPTLLDMGKVRCGIDGEPAPPLKGLKHIGGDRVINTHADLTAAFACCFHTTESPNEILKLIKDICIKKESISFTEGKNYEESFRNLNKHLVKLHHLLPGKHAAKFAKIYWNERLENLLIPQLLEEKGVNMKDLLFAVIPGEKCSAKFQAQNIDFSMQLEFVGFKKVELMKEMRKEITRIGKAVMNQDILPHIDEEIATQFLFENTLMHDAQVYSFLNRFRLHLQSLKNKNQITDFLSMPTYEQKELIRKMLQG